MEWHVKEYTPMSQRGSSKTSLQLDILSFRDVNNEEEENDRENLMTMRAEYERYKDLWGLNLHYSHSAGPTKNYSEFYFRQGNLCQNL